MNTQNIIASSIKGLVSTGMITMLVACGGGGGGGGNDTVTSKPIVARGVITQLGSIYVNGVKYETPASGSYSSDDDDTVSGDVFKVGQVVSLHGSIDDNGVTGTADSVEYEAEIEGTADIDGKINGIEIWRTPTTNAPGIPDPLANVTRYEVSGIWIDDFTIEATFIKTDDDGGSGDTIDEIKGVVQVVNSASSFDVKDITFNMAGGAPHGLSVDNFVEVHFDSCTGISPDIICTASRVDLEDDIFDQAEGIEIEFEGAVDKIPTDCPAEAEFKVDGVCIDSSSKPAEWLDGLTSFDDLVQGSRVEVEGHMISTPTSPSTIKQYLRADKVKGRGNRVRVSSIASNVSPGSPCTFELIEGNIIVEIFDCVSSFEGDASTGALLDITNIDGEEVEVRGIRTGIDIPTGKHTMTALRVKADGLSSGNRHELRAEVDVDGVNKTDLQVKIMGIFTQGIAGISGTELEQNDAPFGGTLSGFLDLIDDNNDATDGPRSVIDVDFEIDPGNGSLSSPYQAHQYEIENEDD